MPPLSNPRHEKFAQGLAEGRVPEAAYEEAGFKPARQNAHRLMTKDDIRRRVAELQAKAAERCVVTIESLTQELDEARRLAMADEKGASAAVAATMGKAKLHGFLVDRSENVNINHDVTDEPISPEEWDEQFGARH